MNKRKLIGFSMAWVGAFALILAITLLFQVPGVKSQGPDETDLEQDKARAAEQTPPTGETIQVYPDNGAGGTHPLFAGVDDATIPAVLIDVTNNNTMNAFSGVQVWGAAYDYDDDIVYFNNGSVLWEWPVGGSPNMLGTMVNGTGATQALVSLAYYNGTLYGTKNIAPEAVHIINPVSLIVTPTITYPIAHDMGGLSIDRDTGTIYATDDGTPDNLVIINNDGTVTPVVAYPAGQTDIDGLAVGGGKAYMVTDDANGNIYVYNLNTNMYEAPLIAPWPTLETFSAGAWIEQIISQPQIDLVKTVGTDPNVCAATNSITVNQGTDVTYCYDVTNTGTITLSFHDLVDTELGTILNGFPYELGPGASAFLTNTGFIFNTTVNTATWTACNFNINGPANKGFDCGSINAIDVVSDTASATVIVPPPGISLSKTVGTDPNVCATTSNISVDPGTDVTYCYEVTNTGGVTLTVHELDDTQLGTILTGFPFDLDPGASAFVTTTANIVTDTVNVATWTACNIDGPPNLTCFDTAAFEVVSDTATANVTINPPNAPSIALTKTVGLDNSTCATSNNLSVGQPSTEVYYCYHVVNTGDVTFTTHDLIDDKLGTILSGLPFVLGPGEDLFVYPVTAVITTAVTNVATWTAYIDTATFVAASASATVTEAPTGVSLNSFAGGSNFITLPAMIGLLSLLVFAASYIIRRLQADTPIE